MAEKVATRDPYFDNIRAVLITLVVMGHLLASITSHFGIGVYLWIYSFHMPAFVLITGYFSQRFTGKARQYERLISALLIPYFIFQTYQFVVRTLLVDGDAKFKPWNPGWTLWFLLALIIWRMLTPIFQILRFRVLLAVLISVLAPLDGGTGTFLSWGRVLSFLPFFVIGLSLQKHHFDWLQTRRWTRPVAVLTVAVTGALAFIFREDVSTGLFYMRHSYESMDLDPLTGMLTRVAVLAVALLLTVAVIALIPSGKYWWTVIGKNSLSIYLFHAALILPLRHTEFFDNLDGFGKILLFFAGFGVVVVFSRPWFVRATKWLTSPPLRFWLVTPENSAEARR